jgi:hypothetical protein
MGHGLSSLQRWLLVEAAKQRPIKEAEPRLVADKLMKTHYPEIAKRMSAAKPNGVDLYYWEVMDRYFDIRTRHRKLRPGLEGWKAFSTREYKSAAAALSRSVTRLERRGLVQVFHGSYSRWAGIRLTDLGKQIAEKFDHEGTWGDAERHPETGVNAEAGSQPPAAEPTRREGCTFARR